MAADIILPRGIVYRLKSDRPDAPHQFGVRDKALRTYAWQSFSNKGEGDKWARAELESFKSGRKTAAKPLVEDVGKAYLAALNGEATKDRKPNGRHLQQVQEVIDGLIEAGARDMSAGDFAAKVQSWLNEMKACRNGQTEPEEASPRTKRRKLTIARSLVNYCMKQEGQPLRYNPLAIIRTPRVMAHDKPVFTMAELRTLLSDESRYRGARLRKLTQDAVDAAGGNKAEAAKALDVHFATVHNRLKANPQEDGWWLYFALALYTGARPSEVQFMMWEWIQWDQRLIELPADADGNKMDSARLIPIQPELMTILRERFKVGMTGYILPEDVTSAKEWRTQSFQNYLTRCGMAVDGRGPHSLRHQHAAIALAMQMHVGQLMLNQGWESAKVAKNYQRTATRFRHDVAGWGSEEFYIRRTEPVAKQSRKSRPKMAKAS